MKLSEPPVRARSKSKHWWQTPGGHVALFTCFVAVVSSLAFVFAVRHLHAMDGGVPAIWPFLAAGFVASSVWVMHIQFRSGVYSATFAEIPAVLGLFFLGPLAMIGARLVGAIGTAIQCRRVPSKMFFNIAALAPFETTVAVLVFRGLVGKHAVDDPIAWLAALLAMVVTNMLSFGLILLVMRLAGEEIERRGALTAAATTVVTALANTSVALITTSLLHADRKAAWLLIFVASIVFFAYRAYTSLGERYTRLEMLYGFTRLVGPSREVQTTADAILSQARELLRAQIAEIELYDGERVTRLTIGSDGRLRRSERDARSIGLREGVHASGRALVAPIDTKDDVLRGQLRLEGFNDAIIAPLRSENDVIGTMLVANRANDVRTFDAEDLKLFETLANHGSVSLLNSELLDRLRREVSEREHQALHDSLTGLPNRVKFNRAVEDFISTSHRDGGGSAAVMLMDLDRFKEVNDTLGHHNGDLLLQAISDRLSNALENDVVIARPGGDEFTLLVPGVASQDRALAVADQISATFREPFLLRDLTLEVGASIGIALYPYDGHDAATLLQRADVAMYEAKENHSQYALYDPKQDQYSPRRLALLGELRAAIADRELTVEYQPIADLHDARVVAVEALVRWQHPQHGFIPPDEFIPVAEHTDVIRPLTLYVLGTALTQIATWRKRGIELGISVNLSVRNLVDTALPDDVARLLADSGVPASALTLEVTEGSIMADPPRTIGVLERLNQLGVSISVDDFGTGYSSLAYLKRLPVNEVKIDKSFVRNMAFDDNDAVIVRSTIDLGHNLGLQVVAEGIEDSGAWQRLVDLGCDFGQGFLLSRPVPAQEIELLLARRGEWVAGPANRSQANQSPADRPS